MTRTTCAWRIRRRYSLNTSLLLLWVSDSLNQMESQTQKEAGGHLPCGVSRRAMRASRNRMSEKAVPDPKALHGFTSLLIGIIGVGGLARAKKGRRERAVDPIRDTDRERFVRSVGPHAFASPAAAALVLVFACPLAGHRPARLLFRPRTRA